MVLLYSFRWCLFTRSRRHNRRVFSFFFGFVIYLYMLTLLTSLSMYDCFDSVVDAHEIPFYFFSILLLFFSTWLLVDTNCLLLLLLLIISNNKHELFDTEQPSLCGILHISPMTSLFIMTSEPQAHRPCNLRIHQKNLNSNFFQIVGLEFEVEAEVEGQSKAKQSLTIEFCTCKVRRRRRTP